MFKKIAVSVLIFLVTLEVGFRIKGRYYTSNEKNSGRYESHYKKKYPTWYHHWTPGKTVQYKTAEFYYENTYNELGHREKPLHSFLSDTTSRKVICIGDSFTEGDGTCYDSTWVKCLEELYNQAGEKKTRFYNAGVCGSDVFFSSKMLQDKLMQLKPVEVIECLNTSDLNDVIWLGGNDRFNADGTSSGKHGPVWGIGYKYSHIVRAVIHGICGYNDNLVKKTELAEKQREAALLIAAQVESTASFCKSRNILYRLVIHSCPHEIKTPDQALEILKQNLLDKEYTIDISRNLAGFYQLHDINKYSYVVNGHFNSPGYWAMGEIIYKRLTK